MNVGCLSTLLPTVFFGWKNGTRPHGSKIQGSKVLWSPIFLSKQEPSFTKPTPESNTNWTDEHGTTADLNKQNLILNWATWFEAFEETTRHQSQIACRLLAKNSPTHIFVWNTTFYLKIVFISPSFRKKIGSNSLSGLDCGTQKPIVQQKIQVIVNEAKCPMTGIGWSKDGWFDGSRVILAVRHVF